MPGAAPASRVATRLRVPAGLVAAVLRCARGSRQGLAVGGLLLGGLSLTSDAAGAQRVAPATGSPTGGPGAPPAGDALEEQAAARVAAERGAAERGAAERGAAERGAAGPPDRDLVMARNLAWWSARLPRDAGIVVWTATTHAARAPGAPAVRPLGVPPLGERLAERWGDRLAVIGFTALGGQGARARQPSQPLAPLPPHSLEARALAAGAAGDVAGWAYLDRAALRSLGAVSSRLFGTVTTTDWSTVFDGVLVIRDEAAPTFEPWR